ncbi:hypothetical protein SK128_019705, partial [Halocaridina rubra]
MHLKRESDWLVKSIKDGDIEMHYMDESGNTILHKAVDTNNILTVKFLIDVGSLVVARNSMNQTPLDIAVEKGYTEIVNLFGTQSQMHTQEGCAADAYMELLDKSARSVGLDTYSEGDEDEKVQEEKLEIVKEVGELMKVVPHDPIGSCDRHLLSLAISTNNRTLLPLFLAAGMPLTIMDSGLGIIQLAKYTEDITTWVFMVVTR